MPAPKLFTDTHDSKTVRAFLSVCDMYFKLTGMSNKKTKALFAKTCLSHTAYTWYNSQGYDKTMVTFANMKSHMLDHYIPSNYDREARRALVACKMG